jgi:hypothetical protein
MEAREDKMKIIEKEFNVSTGQETITERDETAPEKKARELLDADFAVKQAEAEAKATAKAALLVQLGITEEQAKLLLA